MDWFSLLLLVVFFIVPLIQQIAEARKQGDQPSLPPDEGEIDEAYLEAEEAALRRRKQGSPASDVDAGGWSADWGGWPGETPEPSDPVRAEPANPEPISQKPSTTLADITYQPPRPRDPRDVLQRPERVVVDRLGRAIKERSVAVEITEIDRVAEHNRFHARIQQAAVERPRTRSRSDSLGRALRDRGELRRAVLLTEVLGPPRALRPLDHR